MGKEYPNRSEVEYPRMVYPVLMGSDDLFHKRRQLGFCRRTGTRQTNRFLWCIRRIVSKISREGSGSSADILLMAGRWKVIGIIDRNAGHPVATVLFGEIEPAVGQINQSCPGS